MAKSALNNTILYGVGSLVKACASFFLLPFYTSILGAVQYGQLSILQTTSIIISSLVTFALERSLYRLYHDYKREEDKVRFLSTVFIAINEIGLFIILLFALFGNYLTPYLGGVDFMTGLFPVVLYSYINALINYCQIILQTKQEGGKYVIISLIFVVLYNVICIILLLFYSPTYQSMIYATLLTTLLIFPLAFSMIKKQICFCFDWVIMKSVIVFSLPILGSILFSWILNFSDRLFLANMTNMKDVGLYSFAAKIVSVIPLFCGAIFQSYVPYFFSVTNNMADNASKNKLKPVNDTIEFMVCLFCLLLVLIYNLLLQTVFSSEYSDSIDFFYLLIVGAMIGQQTGLLNNMLLQNKKTVSLSIISIFSGFLSVLFNLILISSIGRIGAAVSSLLVSLALTGITYLKSRREYYIPFNFRILFGAIMCISFMYIVDFSIKNIVHQTIIKLLAIAAYFQIINKLGGFDMVLLNKIYKAIINKVIVYKIK